MASFKTTITNQYTQITLPTEGFWRLKTQEARVIITASENQNGDVEITNFSGEGKILAKQPNYDVWIKTDQADGVETTLIVEDFFFDEVISGGASQGGSPDLSNYVQKTSSQPQTIESDLVIGATKNISLLKNPSLPAHATNKEYVDSTVSKAGSIFYDLTKIPSKENLILNITGDTIKNGTPMSGSNTSFESAISSVAAFNLQYDANQNQSSFGVTSGFNNDNRGYSPTEGFWYIGKVPRINYINIADYQITQTTGLTLEIDFSFDALGNDWLALFGITQGNLGSNPDSLDYKTPGKNFRVEKGGNPANQLRIYGVDSQITNQNGNLGVLAANTRQKIVITIEGTSIKGYNNYSPTYTATTQASTETFKVLYLNRGRQGSDTFANMKIYKLRLWNRALSEQEVASLAQDPAPSFDITQLQNLITQHTTQITDLQSQVAVQESQIQDLELLLPIAPKLVYKCSDLPNKNLIQLNLTPAVIKNGQPLDGNNLDFDSVISHDPTLFNLQYDSNQNQQNFGVTTGFNNNNRGYSPTEGYWWIGRQPRINFINIESLNLTQTTGLTIELEFETTAASVDSWVSVFAITTHQNPTTNAQVSEFMSTNNFNILWGSSDFRTTDKRGANLINPNMGNGGINTRIKMVFTIENQIVKGYRDFNLVGSGTLENYSNENYKYILLNRGAYTGDARYANIKIFKMRLWSGALTAEQIASLANM